MRFQLLKLKTAISVLLGGGVYSKGDVYSRGSVYFKIRDFRGRSFEGGVYSRRGVYSRKYGTRHFPSLFTLLYYNI